MTRKIVMIMFLVVVASLIATAAMAERLAISGKVANIRSGPGTNYEVIWQAEKNYPLEVVQTKGDWVLFKDYEGDKGWISRSLTSTEKTVIVKNPSVNVRSGASTKSPIVFKAQKGTPFQVLKTQGEWLQVKHADGDTGWVHNSVIW